MNELIMFAAGVISGSVYVNWLASKDNLAGFTCIKTHERDANE